MIQSINSAVLKGSVNIQLAISGLMKRPPTRAIVGTVGLVAATSALAGNGGDTLLKDSYDSTMGVATGYGGKLATGVSGTFAMIGSVFKFQPQLLMSALGVGFTANGIDNIVDFTVTALI